MKAAPPGEPSTRMSAASHHAKQATCRRVSGLSCALPASDRLFRSFWIPSPSRLREQSHVAGQSRRGRITATHRRCALTARATRFYRVTRAVRAHCRDAQPPRLTRHMPLLFAHADVMAMVVEASTRRGRSGRTRARRTTTPRRACRSSASHGATQQISSWTARPAAPPS